MRLYFSAFAYVMMETLRGWDWHEAGAGAELDPAGEIAEDRGTVRITSRKVWLSFSESYPYAALLRTALTQVQALPLRC